VIHDTRVHGKFPFDLENEAKTLVLATVGSRAHNTHLSHDDPYAVDDVDLMSIVLPPRRYFFGLDNWEGSDIKDDDFDATFYSLHKFVRLLLKSNPNVLGLLWLPTHCYHHITWDFAALIGRRQNLVSKAAYHSFIGYARSQLRDIHKGTYAGYMGTRRRKMVDEFGYDVKHAAHCIRLLRMGIEFLSGGELIVYRKYDGHELRAIKRGEWSLERVQREAEDLFFQAEEEYKLSRLPEKPNSVSITDWLENTTRQYLCAG
jgi:predicted nucleotidyltransferase